MSNKHKTREYQTREHQIQNRQENIEHTTKTRT